jgi:prepilin-type N-terminal cleavage/methylation domain-containing protein
MATRRGFTIVELLVTLGIIGLLVGILLPALSIVRGNAAMASSTSHMRQTFLLMGNYSSANRDTVVPSLFDHSQVAVKGKVRADAGAPVGNRFMGTWADILWTDAGFGPIVVDADDGGSSYDYRSDAPDGTLWQRMGDFERGCLRATVQARAVFDGTVSADADIQNNAYGSRSLSQVEPGMFAANNFFDARPGVIDTTSGLHSRRRNTNHPFDAVCNASANRTASNQPMATAGAAPQYSMYFTNAQVLRPDGSAYLVDSVACETIDPVDDHARQPQPFHTTDQEQVQVAFRYPGDTCAMLMLDGHVRTEQRWDELLDLEGFANDRSDTGQLRSGASADRKDQGRGVRFRHLDQR